MPASQPQLKVTRVIVSLHIISGIKHVEYSNICIAGDMFYHGIHAKLALGFLRIAYIQIATLQTEEYM